ncbi:MAG: MBL fold metallo-hydrolase [Clostridiales bacterium]|nr:MBL fold metallo-hydrolase [Clostridiales bacterium]
MRLVSLSSGSRGNAILVSSENTRLLVDCGISAKRIADSLKILDTEIESIDAVLVTHEHGDHIKGLKRLMSAYGIPVYATEGTLNALPTVFGDEYFNYAGRRLMEPLRADFAVTVGDIDVFPYTIYHDASEPCGFRFECGSDGTHTAVITDCGHYDDYIADHLSDLDALILEANHDLAMLSSGPYPAMLKRRIMSMRGHLSNNDAGDLLSRIFVPGLKNVVLAHLSMENNTHEKAVATVAERLSRRRGAEAAELVRLSVAPQDGLSEIIE